MNHKDLDKTTEKVIKGVPSEVKNSKEYKELGRLNPYHPSNKPVDPKKLMSKKLSFAEKDDETAVVSYMEKYINIIKRTELDCDAVIRTRKNLPGDVEFLLDLEPIVYSGLHKMTCAAALLRNKIKEMKQKQVDDCKVDPKKSVTEKLTCVLSRMMYGEFEELETGLLPRCEKDDIILLMNRLSDLRHTIRIAARKCNGLYSQSKDLCVDVSVFEFAGDDISRSISRISRVIVNLERRLYKISSTEKVDKEEPELK